MSKMDTISRKIGLGKGPRFGVRHKQCLLLFCCQFTMYTVLLNVSLAIVAMTDSSKANPDFEEFDWNEQTRATILSSFFWGYVLSQIPCGTLAARYGNKNVLLVGVAANSLLNLIIPSCTILGGSAALLTARVLQGLFQGALFPTTHGLIASWAPIQERSRLSVLVYPGAQIGTVVALSTGGLVASSSLGWPGIFYIWGAGGCIWCVVWWFYGANGPAQHKSISPAERDYIIGSRSGDGKRAPTPWRKIFRSKAFYALLVTHTCGSYSFWTITTITPSFIKGLFQVDIQQNALLSSVPPIAMFFMSHIFSALAKYFMTYQKWSLRRLRVLFNTVGFVVPAFALIGIGFVTNDNIFLAVMLLTIAYGMTAAIFFGYYVNHMDLCPSHAAVLMSVTNSCATVSGIFATLSVGWFVTDETNPRQWQIIFGIGAGLFAIGTVAFAFFARFDNQNWIVENEEQTTKPSTVESSLNSLNQDKSDNVKISTIS